MSHVDRLLILYKFIYKLKIKTSPSSNRFVLFCWNMKKNYKGPIIAKTLSKNKNKFQRDLLYCISRIIMKLQ